MLPTPHDVRIQLMNLLPIIVVVGTCLLCYLPGIGDYYLFDSRVWLERNDALSIAAPGFPALYEAVLSGIGSGPLGRPLSMLSFAIESVFAGGMHPVVSNLVNVLLHLINGLLLYAVLRQLVLHTRMGAWRGVKEFPEVIPVAVAALWLLHPLHVSTVLYAVQRMTLLSSMGVLAGILVFLRWRIELLGKPGDVAGTVRVVILVLCLTLAAALAKESGLLLPWFLALLEVFCFRYVVAGKRQAVLRWICVATLALPPSLVVAALVFPPDYLAFRFAERQFDMPQRVLTQCRVLWAYMHWIALPDLRSLGFYHDDISASQSLLAPLSTLAAVAAWAATVAAAWLLRARWPLLGFALGWFLLAHVIESTVLPLEMVFEHRNYLAAAAPLLLLVGALMQLLAAAPRALRAFVLLLVSALMSVLLTIRAQYWGDELQLSAYHLQWHPGSQRSIFHFANTNLRQGERERDESKRKQLIVTARNYYENLLESEPQNLVALISLLYIDEKWFPGLAAQDARVDDIRRAFHHGRLGASDYNAIGMLIDCVNQKACQLREGVIPLLLTDALASGCCSEATIEYQAARYELGIGDDPLRALEHARRAIGLAPDMYAAYLQAIEAEIRLDRHADAAETVGEWLRRDTWSARLFSMVSLIN